MYAIRSYYESVDEPSYRELLEFGRHGSGVKPADIEQRVQQIGHRRERMLLAVNHCERAFVLDRAPQRTVEEAERLHGLPRNNFV